MTSRMQPGGLERGMLGRFLGRWQNSEMSAMCSSKGWRAVNDGPLKSTAPSITARPTPQEKRLVST